MTGNSWFNEAKYLNHASQRYDDRLDGIAFFMQMVKCNAKRLAIENPVGIMSSVYRKPDQIIQPWMFGDAFEKKTCLWLRNLKSLTPTNIVEPPTRKIFESGKTMPSWYADLWKMSREDRSRERSKTFPGIARAMAEQWGDESYTPTNNEETHSQITMMELLGETT